MVGLVKRAGVYIYRREVPPKLRSILGKREVKESLRTSDEALAQRRVVTVAAKVDQMFQEARAALQSPSVFAYKVVQEDRPFARERDDKQDEALDVAITNRLEQNDLDPATRAALLALLKRNEDQGDSGGVCR